MRKEPEQVKVARRLARQERLEAENTVGRCRASTWGRKDTSPKAERRQSKKDIRAQF